MKFCGMVKSGPMTKQPNFGRHPVRNPYPRFLNPHLDHIHFRSVLCSPGGLSTLGGGLCSPSTVALFLLDSFWKYCLLTVLLLPWCVCSISIASTMSGYLRLRCIVNRCVLQSESPAMILHHKQLCGCWQLYDCCSTGLSPADGHDSSILSSFHLILCVVIRTFYVNKADGGMQ